MQHNENRFVCARGGMLESFLICPVELTDDQVMERLKSWF